MAELFRLNMSLEKTDLIFIPLVVRTCVEVEDATKTYKQGIIDVLEALILLNLSPWTSQAGQYLIE
jgi:hypothetical protein